MDFPTKIVAVPALEDNYIYFLVKGERAAVIDPGETRPALEFLQGKTLEAIIITHYHKDHTGGSAALKETGAPLYASYDERIAGVDHKVRGGDGIVILDEPVDILATPGHTKYDITYYFPILGVAFTADCLFSGGCGRLFEGTAEEMYKSLQKIMRLPEETKLYFGHEYTRKNLTFGLTIEPDNEEIKMALERLEVPTTPTTVAREKCINVFVRAKNVEEFAEIRKKRDAF